MKSCKCGVNGYAFKRQVAGLDIVVALQLVAGLAHGVIRSSHGDESDLGLLGDLNHGRGNVLAHGFELVRQAIHVVDVIDSRARCTGLVVVAAAAREIGRGGVIGAGKRAIADAIAVQIPVAGAKPPSLFRSSAVSTLPRLMGCSGYSNAPAIQLFIPRSRSCHDEDRGLEALGQVEGFDRHGKTLFGRARKIHGCRVSPWERMAVVQDVALLGARGQAGGGGRRARR